MKRVLVLLLLLLNLSAYSQFWRSISYGLEFSYDQCYRNFDSDNKDYISYRDSLEKPGTGYQAGLHLMRPINKHFSIETSFIFQNHIYGTDKINYSDSIYSVDYNIWFTDASWHYKYKSLSIPVGLRYYFNGDRVSAFMGAGITPSIITAHIEDHTFFNDDKITLRNSYYQNDAERFNISGYANAGLSIFLSYYTRIDLSVGYKRSLMPVLKNNIYYEYLHSWGLTFCISQTI